MLKLKIKNSQLQLFSLLALALATPTWAQENLSPPPGWTKSAVAGDVSFFQSSSNCRLVIKKLTPLGGSLRNWFELQTERDGKARGEILSAGKVQSQQNALTLVRSFRSGGGNQSVIYTGYAVGKSGRLLSFSGPNALALAQSIGELNAVGERLGEMDTATARRSASASPSKTTSTQRKSVMGKAKVAKLPPKLAPVSAKGTLKNSQILGVYLLESYTSGVGGMVIIQYDPVLLLRDGAARRDLEIPPLDLNVAQDKAAHASDWGRWTRSGAKIKVRWSAKDSDEIKASFKTRPAKPGETLVRGYTSMGGGGNTALGGDVMTFYSNSYLFARDGRFATKSSGGGGNSSVTAYSSSKNGGRYRLDSHALTLKFNDGRQVRRLFYFYPNDNKSDVIGIGDSAFIGDD